MAIRVLFTPPTVKAGVETEVEIRLDTADAAGVARLDVALEDQEPTEAFTPRNLPLPTPIAGVVIVTTKFTPGKDGQRKLTLSNPRSPLAAIHTQTFAVAKADDKKKTTAKLAADKDDDKKKPEGSHSSLPSFLWGFALLGFAVLMMTSLVAVHFADVARESEKSIADPNATATPQTYIHTDPTAPVITLLPPPAPPVPTKSVKIGTLNITVERTDQITQTVTDPLGAGPPASPPATPCPTCTVP